jgi:leucyl/phenylalanyl-tRNA---protein transferase
MHERSQEPERHNPVNSMSSVENRVLEIPKQIPERVGSTPRFHETLPQRLRRLVLGGAYAIVPQRIALLPRLMQLSIEHLFAPAAERDRLPDNPVYYSKRGLVGISNDLSVNALIANYRRGYFPISHVGSMKWWSPEERAIIDPAATHVGKNLRRLLRQQKFRVTFDRDFAGVIEACAQPRSGKVPLTWITPRVMSAFYAAHKAGYAHSVEVWDQQGRLVGGLYGMAIGKVFFGESQFSYAEHSSKIALVALHRHLSAWGYHMRDGKVMTPHLASFGFTNMPRREYQTLLRRYVNEPGRACHWSVDPSLDLADWPSTQAVETAQPARQASA